MSKELAAKGENALARKRKPPRVETTMTGEREAELLIKGNLGRIQVATGGGDVMNGLLQQLAALGSHGKAVDDASTNFALGYVDAMQPEDATEALLLAQMATIHQATMLLARRLNHVETIPQQDAAERALNKLARTFAAQMDTLKRYRSKGQQVMRVERVTVNEGGQAIVGTVDRGAEREK